MAGFQDFLTWGQTHNAFNPSNILYVLKKLGDLPIVNKGKYQYYNIPCAFDIETSSFYDDTGQKTAIMYEWTFGIGGLVIIGRTWKSFLKMIKVLSYYLGLNKYLRLVCFIHNAGFEFQFLRKWLKWDKVFAIEERRPVYMICDLGIEFRCSYILSGYSLAKLGDQLLKYKVKKLVGDLDYSKIRHSKTKMYDQELQYCINDVLVVMCYIQEKLENEGKICFLPITKTGYVRNYCRNFCFYEYGKSRKDTHKKNRYLRLMSTMTLTVPEYKQLKRAFAGGFTHAGSFYSGRLLHNVTSVDFTSSYPTIMLSEQFPMSSAEEIEITSKQEFFENLKLYCCVFDAHFEGVESKFIFENYISESHCDNKKGVKTNNGRIVSADSFDITLTNVDFSVIYNTYTWKSLKVGNFRRYRKGYLPRDLIKAILKLYENKTKLKNVEGKELEYQKSKEMVNAVFGCSVTDPCRSIITYDNVWDSKEPDLEKVLDKYNRSGNRFLFYPWGVFITSYGRRNVWAGILECKEDYIYSDTDSIKMLNIEKHRDFINKYNDLITKQLENVMDIMHISHEKIRPKTNEGVEKPLGVWDFDGEYKDFKAIRAKTYMYRYSDDKRNKHNAGKLSLTVSGLNKKIVVPYLVEKYGDNVFDHFDNKLYIPREYTGNNTHTYIDDERRGFVTDYQGVTCEYYEKSCIHIEQSEYSLSLTKEYRDYILGVQKGSIC